MSNNKLRRLHSHKPRKRLARHHALLRDYYRIIRAEQPELLSSKFFLGPISTKGNDIYWAIEDHLPGKPPHDPSWKMKKYQLDSDDEMRGFLVAVGDDLSKLPAHYVLKMNEALVQKATGSTLQELRGILYDATKP